MAEIIIGLNYLDHMKEQYTEWMAGDDDKSRTAAGNLRAPSKELLARWVVASWQKLSPELIKKSFLSCGLTNAVDGSEDDLIVCLQGETNTEARALLRDSVQQAVLVDEDIDEDVDELDEIDIC